MMSSTRKNERNSQAGVTRFTYRNRVVEVPDDHLAVGMIMAPHGLKGETRVELHTDMPERFEPGLVVYLGRELTPLTVKSARPHKGHLLIHFEGVYNREAVDALRNQWLFVHEDDAVELEEDAYFVHDIVGLKVFTTAGRLLGSVTDVLFTGANEVYIVETEATVNQGKELLLPAIADVVQKVSLTDGAMTVELPDGLLDE